MPQSSPASFTNVKFYQATGGLFLFKSKLHHGIISGSGPLTCPDCGAEMRILAFIEEDRVIGKNSQASGPTPRRLARSAAPGARLRADLQRLARRGRGRRCLPALLSAQRAFGDGPFLLPGARPGHPEAQNAPEPAREAQNGVDSRSGILQTPKELVESPFPLRNQTWKETFCSWTRKPNSYPFLDPKTKFLSLAPASRQRRKQKGQVRARYPASSVR